MDADILLGRLAFLLRVTFASGSSGERTQHATKNAAAIAVAAAVVIFTNVARSTASTPHDGAVLGSHLLVSVALLY